MLVKIKTNMQIVNNILFIERTNFSFSFFLCLDKEI